MSEEMLIRHCAPTLAGIKTGNLFSCECPDREESLARIRELNRRLVPRGLRILPMKCAEGRMLIYVYRPAGLSADLSRAEVREILLNAGYRAQSCDGCVMELMRRVNALDGFPHEIGLFLSYPPEDVRGFIEHRDTGCKLTGCWKVYGDEDQAKKIFERYKLCTRRYCAKFAQGAGVESLTVAS